jgi:hypothetical protein
MSELLMHPMGGGTGSDDLTATSANVLSGKTAVTSDSDDEAIEGTMANNGAMDVTLTPAGNGTTSKEVAEGYYSGGTITADGAAAYSAGHSQGVTDADNRVNTSSASYNSGYTNGYSADNRFRYIFTVHKDETYGSGIYQNVRILDLKTLQTTYTANLPTVNTTLASFDQVTIVSAGLIGPFSAG